MNTTALLLAVTLAANPPSATTTQVSTERGFLSGLGIGLLVAGAGGVAAGIAGVMNANDTQARYDVYLAAPAPEDAANRRFLEDRLAANTALALVGFAAGGLALAGGIFCLVVDSPGVKVAFAPGPNGGVLVFSGRF